MAISDLQIKKKEFEDFQKRYKVPKVAHDYLTEQARNRNVAIRAQQEMDERVTGRRGPSTVDRIRENERLMGAPEEPSWWNFWAGDDKKFIGANEEIPTVPGYPKLPIKGYPEFTGDNPYGEGAQNPGGGLLPWVTPAGGLLKAPTAISKAKKAQDLLSEFFFAPVKGGPLSTSQAIRSGTKALGGTDKTARMVTDKGYRPAAWLGEMAMFMDPASMAHHTGKIASSSLGLNLPPWLTGTLGQAARYHYMDKAHDLGLTRIHGMENYADKVFGQSKFAHKIDPMTHEEAGPYFTDTTLEERMGPGPNKKKPKKPRPSTLGGTSKIGTRNVQY
tara:strand:+ start:150 stop:1145 length:996 start_codon:yes stop_codon:yes gene_type:complete